MSSPTTAPAVEAAVRIPGTWESPMELRERLPDGYVLTTEGLQWPDGSRCEIFLLPPDPMFPDVFARACTTPPRKAELRKVKQYEVNFCLAAPVGNRGRVLELIEAISAVIQAGGAGVFVDNSGVACGASAWLEFAQSDDAESTPVEALCNVIRSERGLFSVGMHLFGSRDLVLRSSGNEAEDAGRLGRLMEILAADPSAFDNRGWFDLPELQGLNVRTDRQRQLQPVGHPMHNPFGRWLVEVA